MRSKLYTETHTSDEVAGNISKEWAKKLGLSEDTVIAVGTFDAHSGAVGAKVEEHALVRVMGTSTCDIIVSPYKVVGDKTVRGICGQVDGSVIPGMIGLEAGQSAWEAYKTSHCDSVYTIWMDGTIRGAMTLSCQINLTEARTHEIWSSYLTYMDSTPAIMPEPELTYE